MANKTKFYVGTDRWGREEWVGTLYPTELKGKTMLEYYSDTFNFVELRATYYSYDAQQIQNWIDTVDTKSFKFSPWIPKKYLFRLKPGSESISEISAFISTWNNLDKLGPFIVTLDEKYTAKSKTDLFNLIDNLSPQNKHALNIIDVSWFTTSIMDEILDHANRRAVAVIMKNTDYFKKVKSRFLYLRIDIADQPDFRGIIAEIPDTIEEVYLCVTGTDKIKVLKYLREF